MHDENGVLFSLPAGWTDVVPADPFVAIADGRCPFTAGGLLALADMIGRLRSEPDCQISFGLAAVHAADLPVGQSSRDRPSTVRLNPCGQFLVHGRDHHRHNRGRYGGVLEVCIP